MPSRISIGPDRSDEQRLERAALPFAGHDQRGQEGADERHDQHDQPGNQEVMAVVGVVEPHAALHDYRAQRNGTALGGLARSPLRRSRPAA